MDETNDSPVEVAADSKPAAEPIESKRPFEGWAALKQIEAWKVGAAKALRGWPIGFEVTEAAFDQAVNDACNHTIR